MNITIKIAGGVRCINLPLKAKRKIEKDLSFPNPEYETAKKRGAAIPADMPAKVVLWDYEEETDTTWIPRGYVYWILKFLRLNGYNVEIKDHTLLLKPLNLKFLGKLKPYQEKANKSMLKYPVGVLEGGTGSGKTVVGISLIVSRQQRTLIIVHSKELLYQWRDQIKKFTGEECGLIGDGKFSIEPLTVAIINSVNNNLEILLDKFGHVIIDECHRISAETWAHSLQEFPSKYYLGLTATPYRRDGLGHAIFASIGPKIHTINKKMLYDTKSILRPKVYHINSSFYFLFKNDYSTMISELTKDTNRNSLICKEIARDLKVHNENVIVVSDRKNHCEIMQKMLLKMYKIEGRVLTGSNNKKHRETTIEQISSGKCKVVFATLSLIGEGFDAPNLTALFLTTPVKFQGRLIQVCGRVLRAKKGKIPRIYDVRDNNIDLLKWSGYNRDRIYKKEWG